VSIGAKLGRETDAGYAPTVLGELVSGLSGCLEDSSADAAGKLLALGLLAAAPAQHAAAGESAVMREIRVAFRNAAARYAGMAMGIEVSDE